jgi:gluconate kinase
MPASLLRSQFDTLEEPLPDERVIMVVAAEPPEREVQKIIDTLGRSAPGSQGQVSP